MGKRFSVRRYAKYDYGLIEVPLKPMYAVWDTEAKKFLMGHRGHSQRKVLLEAGKMNEYFESGRYYYFEHDWNIMPLDIALNKVQEQR